MCLSSNNPVTGVQNPQHFCLLSDKIQLNVISVELCHRTHFNCLKKFSGGGFQFLSFKGTMMCLESCFLLRLDEVSDARFFLSFHALYGVLHATLAHHPSSVLRIIPAFLTATKCILVQAFRTDFE